MKYERPFTHHESSTYIENLLFLKGRVASFYGCELRKYTGFRVSTTSDVRSILSITEGPLILTSDSLSLYTRQGLNIFNHK